MAFKKSVQISGGGNDCIEGILHVTKETCIEAIEGTWRLLWSQTLLRSQGSAKSMEPSMGVELTRGLTGELDLDNKGEGTPLEEDTEGIGKQTLPG